MNLLNFIKDYPDEESCKLKYKELRDQIGVVCSKCSCIEHYWKSDKWQYECKKCGKRTTLRSGTAMHGSQLTFRYWFIAIHLLTSTKKSFSALELQRQLGHKRYEPIWEMLHKLREVMGKRDGEYELTDIIELDEGFFSTIVPEQGKDKPIKRGRPQYLQSYLNEFCYKYNRRYFGEKLFDRLLIACVSYKNEF